jgi:hypothetical protein
VPRERFAVPRECDASRFFYLPSGHDELLRLPASTAIRTGRLERFAAGTSACAGSSSDRGDDERGLTGISPIFTPSTVRSPGTGEAMTPARMLRRKGRVGVSRAIRCYARERRLAPSFTRTITFCTDLERIGRRPHLVSERTSSA